MSEVDFSVLKNVGLFADLKNDDEALKLFASTMKIQIFKKGHEIITEGNFGDEFFILIDGAVSISKKTPDGDAYKVVILKADSNPALGEGGLIEKEPRSATITCECDCKFMVLTQADFLNFCTQHPRIAVPVLKSLSITLIARLRKMNDDFMLLHKALMSEIRGH